MILDAIWWPILKLTIKEAVESQGKEERKPEVGESLKGQVHPFELTLTILVCDIL